MGSLDPREKLKRLPRLWCPPAHFTATHVPLTADQDHYLQRVLRLTPPAPVVILDGQGSVWLGHWVRGAVDLETRFDQEPTELPQPLWLGCSVLKGEAMDWLIQKATELGATMIQPVISRYTQRPPSENKIQRWQIIAQEACEQCERTHLPQILPVVGLEQAQCPYPLQVIAVERHQGLSLRAFLAPLVPQPLGIWIGPEGGWSPEELTLARPWQAVSLGVRILRAETATCAALAQCAAWLEG